MLGVSAENKYLQKVADFYHGKNIFITGASGFIGSILLETLLRCSPEIKSIYILLRSKRNVKPEVRRNQIFDKKIFKRLLEENLELLDKVHVIAGDASLPNLGMSKEDEQLLVQEVSVVFHCAAITHFKKPLKFALINNVLSINSVIELCRRMRKFQALIFTSTAYCNYNHTNVVLKEEVYRLPFQAEKFLDALKNEDDDTLEELVGHCKPDWPNTYTFSKCLAENVIMDTASDLPIAIIRPSIVASTWKHPIAAGKGFLKVLYSDPKIKLNFVPADIVVNTLVLAALSTATKRHASPMIVHCTATEKFNIAMSEYCKIVTQVDLKFPLPHSFMQSADCILVPYRYLYYMVVAYHHYLPAIFLDGILKILGKKPKVFASFRFIDRIMNSTSYFRFQPIEFERNNLEYLHQLIHPDDRKVMSLDFSDATFLELSLAVPEVSSYYDWKTDKKSPRERQRIKYWCHVIVTCIQGSFIIIFTILLYWMLFLIF